MILANIQGFSFLFDGKKLYLRLQCVYFFGGT